ncbi:MAG TPA: GGDEF domain-containing protein [Acidimicrobiales bacterium]|nr:GGDEF domain-containing protein [Acidimicrobiales bacterium]
MQDLGDGPRVGPRRLSAVRDERGAPAPSLDDAPVVPAHRLLEVASALSDGATRLHERLRHLEPEEREAVIDLVADQVTEIVTLWSDMVRGVVSAGGGAGNRGTVNDDDERSAPGRPTFMGSHRSDRTVDDHPARIPAYEGDGAPQPVRAPSPSPSPSPAAVLRRESAEAPRDSERLTRDELTGVFNRQAGFAALDREIERCRRGGERFVLGFLNVDSLTAVNDTRGPRAGDELLRKVTAALRATLRSYDVISRLGGDEFLFSLPGADMATAELRFKEFAVILAEEAPGSSASVGFAELHQHDTLDDLVAGAETAMLKSRRHRRRGRG